MSRVSKYPRPTQERVKELFDYDSETGILTWKVAHGSGGRIPAGAIAGGIAHDNSIGVRFDGQLHRVHRLVWLWVHGEWPLEVDHRDNNPANNRLGNLRNCNRAQNTKNVRCHKDTASGTKGAYFDKRKNRWYSRIMVDGRDIHLGLFHTKEQAGAAYDAAALKYHGEFAHTNGG